MRTNLNKFTPVSYGKIVPVGKTFRIDGKVYSNAWLTNSKVLYTESYLMDSEVTQVIPKELML